MKIYQFSCVEGKSVDMRQANAVLRHKPDIIFFEAPNNGRTSSSKYNKFIPSEKPLNELKKQKQELLQVAKKFPWVESDIYVYDNIATLWKEGHDVKLYNVDGPPELLRIKFGEDNDWNPKPYRRGTNLYWWVRIYLRDTIMTKNIQQVLSQYKNKKDLTILIFLQSFHWRNVKFQLSKPTTRQMWDYYFSGFSSLNEKNIKLQIKKENKVLYKYWNKMSEF